MKTIDPLALAVAGPLSGTFLNRRPDVCHYLGPVIAPSFRLARRSSNALRAGFAVRRWDDLKDAPIVVVSAAPERLEKFVRQMAESGLRWRGRTVLLVDSLLDSSVLYPLQAAGAHTCSLIPAGVVEREEYLLEGDLVAVRRMRPWLQRAGCRVHTVSRPTRAVYAAIAALSANVTLALMDAALGSLRAAGVDKSMARAIVERSVGGAIRKFAKGGRRTARRRVTVAEQRELEHLILWLRREDAAMAEYLKASLKRALELAGQDASWIEPAGPE
jgi:hypothetical protein